MSNETFHVADLYTVQAMCAELGVETPEPVERGLHLLAVARAHAEPPTGPLLSLSDDDARGRIDAWSLRAHIYTHSGTGAGLTPGIEQFESQLLSEVHEGTLPYLEGVVVAMRPAFDAAAEALMRGAQRFGFDWQTTSDGIVDREDDSATAAWRDTRDALAAIQTPVRMRIQLSRMFHLAPTVDDVRRYFLRHDQFDEFVSEDQLDFSCCFAAGDNWSFNRDFYIEKNRGGGSMLNWLDIARDGLRLNTPREVLEKLAARETGKVVPSPEAA